MDEKAYVFQAPLAKVGASVGSAAAVNADRIVDAAAGVATHPMLQLTWQNAAAFTATLVSLCVLFDWFWKRFWRPFFVRRGWIKPPQRRVLTEREIAVLDMLRASNDSDMRPPTTTL